MTGPLSVDDAVSALIAADEPAEQPADTQAPETTAEPEAETDAPDAVSEEVEAEAEPEEEAPKVDPPPFWQADDKEAFQALPADLQQKVLAYEKQRDAATSKALQEAAETRKLAEQESSRIAELNARLDKVLEQANETFKSKWPEQIDWAATLQQFTNDYGTEEGLKQYALLKEQYETETRQIAAAKTAKQEAEQARYQTFVQSEMSKLATVEPELVDPKHGSERRQQVAKFLMDLGLPAEDIAHAGALEFSLAYDAMRFRQALKTQPKAPPKPVARTVKPTAPPVQSSRERTVEQQRNRFVQTKTVDDAAALILALENGT